MPVAILRFGLLIAAVGFFSYFFHHHMIASAIITGIGYLLFVIGIVGWSVEASGDVSFS